MTADDPSAAGGRTNIGSLLWYWGPLVVWLVAIFYFSGDTMSARHTSSFFEPLIRRAIPGASFATVYGVHVAVRKCGHVFEYGLLGLLAYRAIRGDREQWLDARWIAAALAIGTGYALIDEFHQTFVSSRTGSIGDVVIDMAGCFGGIVLLIWLLSRQAKATPNRVQQTQSPER